MHCWMDYGLELSLERHVKIRNTKRVLIILRERQMRRKENITVICALFLQHYLLLGKIKILQ